MPWSNDRELVEALCRSDVEAFHAFHTRFIRLIRFAARGVIHEDIRATQEELEEVLFAHVCSRLCQRQWAEESLSGWIFTVARNKALDWRRSRDRHRAVDGERKATVVSLDELTTQGHQFSDERPTQARAYAELEEATRDCIKTLPMSMRHAVELRVFLEYAYEEIAEVAQIPIGAVKDRVSKGRKLLRDCLATKEIRAARGIA